MLRYFSVIFLFLLFLVQNLYALDTKNIPVDLRDWQGWVLEDIPTHECPINYQKNIPQCQWYKGINVALSDQRLDFTMQVSVYQNKTPIELPYAHQSWVNHVTVNGDKAIVTGYKEKPRVILDKGTYTLEGEIPWRGDLKFVQLPKKVALVEFIKAHQRIPNPKIDLNGRLWLDQNGSAQEGQGTVAVSLYRKVIDGHPVRMQTYLHFQVSGEMRSVVLDGILVRGFIPTAINSQLDATLTEDKKLQVEVKAGEWTVWVDSYASQPITQLQKPTMQFGYANEEVWSVMSDANYRTIEIEGVSAVDPSQTTLPEEWKSLPAYLVQEEATLTIKELYKSAKQQQKSQLRLNREMWLDFDGEGYLIDDTIHAEISHVRRLEATPLLDLASASINYKPALITTLEGERQKGIELRETNMKIDASSRYEGDIHQLPANGWDEPFHAINTVLHLPPGWRLFAAFGSDNQTTAWVEQWDLMDIFLVLLLSIAMYQLYGWKWSLPATLFTILLWQESDAPTVIWLFVVVLAAILRVLGSGRLKKSVWGITVLIGGVALLQVVDFSVSQIRTALYPQLEKEYGSGGSFYDDAVPRMREEAKEIPFPSPVEAESGSYYLKNRAALQENVVQEAYSPQQQVVTKSYSKILQNRIDPNAVVQTGIGKPAWHWHSYTFHWQSGVGGEDVMRLWLISPWLNKFLKVINIIGMLFMLYLFSREFLPSKVLVRPKSVASALLLMSLFISFPQTSYAEIPSPQLLEQLKTRLTEPPSCLPDCAQINDLNAFVDEEEITLTFNLSAGADIAVPLFGNRMIWLPQEVTVDGQKTNDLMLDNSGALWGSVTQGVHTIELRGTLHGHPQIMLTSRLPLHNVTMQNSSNRWHLNSDKKSYIEINSLKQEAQHTKAQNSIEPLVEVKRTFYFGQFWYVDTEVRLLNSIEQPYTLRYPLLTDESILDKEIEQKKNTAILHLSNKQSTYQWRSSLPIIPTLRLEAMRNPKVVEVWQMDISTIWAMRSQGIEPIEQVMDGDIIMPRFKPWLGETLSLDLERTQAVKGESLTIESSKMEISQSRRYREVQLKLTLKSSQAGQYAIALGKVKELKPTVINSKTHYLKVDNNGIVTLPLQAASQEVTLRWQEEIGTHTLYRFPTIDLKKVSTNSVVQLTLPEQRWILWTSGPTLGPAVLLWGVVFALILVAWLLGKFLAAPFKTRDWLLLGMGVSTTSLFILLPIVLWIGAFKYRGDALQGWRRNLTQIGLVMLTLIALSTIVGAISAGLLGNPDMMIAGNQSYGNYLNWYSDRLMSTLAEPTVLSVSIWYYRALMLVWSIWVAFALIRWLKWAWMVFSQGDMWVKWRTKKIEAK